MLFGGWPLCEILWMLSGSFYRGLGDINSVHLSVRLSVCLSVTRMLCDETKKRTAEILTPHERVINLVFWYQKRLVGDVPFHLKFVLKVTHPHLKNADFDQYLLITSQPQELAKNVQL